MQERDGACGGTHICIWKKGGGEAESAYDYYDHDQISVK
jgi:hypothetical protein